MIRSAAMAVTPVLLVRHMSEFRSNIYTQHGALAKVQYMYRRDAEQSHL